MYPSPRSTADVANTVLGVQQREPRGRGLVAVFAALAAHASLLFCLRIPLADTKTRSTAELERAPDDYVDLGPLPPPVPPRPPRAEPEQRSPAPKVNDQLTPRLRSPKAPAAQAATIVAQEPDPDAPVDLTADALVTGTARAYAGGLTTSAGTSLAAVQERPSTGERDRAPLPAVPDRASPVSLENENWSCPWPPEAGAQQVDEQTVVIRVVVGLEGTAEQATVLADPGHGFGEAAVACAMRTRFTPARDKRGAAVRATSPPIRVRFTR